MEKEKSNLILGISLALVFLITIGISYAYFAARIVGNESTSTIALSSGKMEIVYEDNTATINLSGIYPREEEWATKRFTLTANNTTNLEMKYKIGISIEQNTFSEGALTYSLKNTLNESGTPLEDVESSIIKTSGTQYIGYGIFDAKINNIKHNYELKIFFKETSKDQNDNQKARFNAKIIVESCTDEELITVTFNPNEGTVSQTTKTVLANGVYGTLPTPTREGYKFLGWNGKNKLGPNDIYYVDAYGTLNSSLVLYNSNTGVYTINGKQHNHPIFGYNVFENVEVNKTYILSAKIVTNSTTGVYIGYQGKLQNGDRDIGKSIINNTQVGDIVYYSFTVPGNVTSLVVGFLNSAGGNNLQIKDFQLEESTTVTAYEPGKITNSTTVVQEQNHTLKAIWKKNSTVLNQNFSDYQEVEYIESTGSQYIDMNVKATNKTMIDAQLYTDETGNKNWFGGSVSSSSYNFIFNSYASNKFEYQYGTSNSWIISAVQDTIVGQIYTIKYGNGAIYINENKIADLSTTTFSDTRNIYLFTRNQNAGIVGIAGKVYYLKIYDNGTLVRNFIPAYRISDGEVGLFDIVNNVFYQNAGTGDFIKGPNVTS